MAAAYRLARPLLMRLPPEAAHGLTLRALRTGLVRGAVPVHPALAVSLWGRSFPGPLGLAAGFDKNAEALAPLLGLGFDFVEAGTVTPLPQAGNPKPRVFRAPAQGAVINAMGFPGQGLDPFRRHLEAFRRHPAGVVGVNIGMNKGQENPAQDYRLLVRALGPLADYLTVNISSPNTPGLRDLQQSDNLKALLGEILTERAALPKAPPVLVKLSPDIEPAQRGEITRTLLASGIDGLVLSNTTLSRPAALPPDFVARKGGLSGLPLQGRALDTLRDFYRLTEGRLPIIGVGGIDDADSAYARIRAGASLLQIYTALVFRGPGVIKDIHDGLHDRLRRDGLDHISQAVGADAGRA